MEALNKTALVLVIVGALNWFLIGLFRYDFVSTVFGGVGAPISRIIFTIVGIAGLYCIYLLFDTQMRRSTNAK